MRTRPPFASTRSSTVAFAPASASVPVRSCAGMCRWARASGLRTASDASEATMNAISCTARLAPTAATTPATTAATAIGPRKNSPGVRISPIASPTATIAQTTHIDIGPQCSPASTPCEAQRRRQSVEILEARLEPGVPAGPVDQDRAHPDRAGAVDVVLDRVADHHRLGGGDLEQVEHRVEDRRVRLGLAVEEGADAGVDVEPVVAREGEHVAGRVGDEPELQAVTAELVEHGQRVLEQL